MSPAPSARCRVVVVGFHGGGPYYVQPMLDAGRLPVLASLGARGTSAAADSVWPVAAGCWVTLLTGLDVAQHGVLDVCENDARWFPSQSARAVTVGSYAGETVFTLASRQGRSVAGLGVPMTAPAFPVDGVLIPSFPCRNERYPDSWPRDVLDTHGPVSLCQLETIDRSDLAQCRAYLDFDLESTVRIGRALYESRDWDLFFPVFKVPDLSNHLFCDNPYLADWRTLMDEYLERTDRAMGELLACIDPESVVVLVSDHGSGPMPPTLFRVSRWLENEGLLTRRRAGMLGHGSLAGLEDGYRRLRANPVARLIRQWLPERVVDPIRALGHHWPFVDLSQTRVYPVDLFYPLAGFEINLRGREAHGIVPKVELDSERARLLARLVTITEPGSKRPVFRRLYRREELFDGPYAERLPDVIGELDPDIEADLHFGAELFTTNRGKPSYPYRGYHRPDALFVIAGPGIPHGRVSGVHVRDLTPTLLTLLDLPVPRDRRGKAITFTAPATA